MSKFKMLKMCARKEEDRKRFLERFHRNEPSPLPNFEIYHRERVIGKGAFSIVYLYKHRKTGKFYACKRLDKEYLVQQKMVEQVLMEKRILQAADCSFVVQLLFSWKDNDFVYFFMPFIDGGDMLTFLTCHRKFSESVCRFYSAQLMIALEYLHAMDIVHRDIKPENVLIDATGYIKLGDFGMSKLATESMWTFCGTLEYMSPEMILSKGYGRSTDWWAFGIFIYEMVYGRTPFHSFVVDQMVLFGKVLRAEYEIPSSFSSDLRNLLEGLLTADVSQRLGCRRKDLQDIKGHKWYRSINFRDIEMHNVKAPMKPIVKHAGDTSNFSFYTDEKTRTSSQCLYEQEFNDF